MIVLDTHAWIWWVDESPHLSAEARKAIEEAEELGVSAISCWEVSMLVAKGRVGFSIDVQEWVNLALQRPKIRLLPLDPQIAVSAARLPGEFHGDPADRLIASTCLHSGAPLVSKDQRIRDWRQIQVIW